MTAVDILRCPDDCGSAGNRGDLSYVVNSGFARWYAIPVGWAGGTSDGQSANGDVLRWAPDGSPWQDSLAVGKKLAVMFLGSRAGNQPWDVRSGLADVADGATNTLLVGENTLAGFSEGTPHSGGLPTNWACPFPNFVTFLGSDDVCRSPASETDCLAGQLRPLSPVKNGPGWKRANERGSPERVNYGVRLGVKGSSPFVSSGHPGGANFAFCDGSVRFLSERIDGDRYASLITPAGSTLPPALRQHPFAASGSGPE
jgi:prepilin-type processing-associated H-X9-DG protein